MFDNRKRVILDRGPSWPDYQSAEAFVIRYYPFFRHRPKWFPFNILIHKILKSDLIHPKKLFFDVSTLPSAIFNIQKNPILTKKWENMWEIFFDFLKYYWKMARRGMRAQNFFKNIVLGIKKKFYKFKVYKNYLIFK